MPVTNPSTFPDPEILALQALAWILSDDDRAERLLALTGLDASGLRASIDQPGQQAAVLDFLCAHEPDLIACADALNLPPAQLAQARTGLNGVEG